MNARVLEAVPNFSEGRDPAVIEAIASAMAREGAEVLDRSADPDHHRAVITVIGAPDVVERAVVAGAAVAIERIDLREHRGVHPRIGALDVLPFVPLVGLDMEDARGSARRVGTALARDLALPVYFYGYASDPPGRGLAELRRGGFEALRGAWPEGRVPDVAPEGLTAAHPTAGAVCVGARKVLLAWNVVVTGLSLPRAAGIAARLRERGGGLPGVRALALNLDSRGALQISMNIENLVAASPMAVLRRLETLVAGEGGRIRETEVIGMIPDELALEAAADRLRMSAAGLDRLLTRRVLRHLEGQRVDPIHAAGLDPLTHDGPA